MNRIFSSLHTAYISAARIDRARSRLSDPEWNRLVPSILTRLERRDPNAFPFPDYDASWYRADQPYGETYQMFHQYVNSNANRTLFSLLRERILGGLVMGNDAWRRQAVEMALRHGAAIDFRVQHYDAGMEYSVLGGLLCDVQLGAADLLSEAEQKILTRLLRQVADAIQVNLDYWRNELPHMPFNNHRICHMAILYALGKVIGDSCLVDPIFDPEDDRSFAHYLSGCLYDNGLCYESSTHYHFATSSFLLSAAMVSDAMGGEEENLFHTRGANGLGLRDILCAPVGLCFTGQVRPRSGDTYGGDMRLAVLAGQLLVAKGVYGTTPLSGNLLPLIAENGMCALCWLESMPGASLPEKAPESRIFPEHGYAVLCQNTPVQRQAFLCGDASGIHHHREGLQLQVQMENTLVLATTEIPPASAHGFSDKIHEQFNRHPFAHSQLEVDGLDQNLRPVPLPIRVWEPDGSGGIARMAMVDDRGELVDGVSQGRFVYMAENWMCDCVFAVSDRDRLWRLYYHLPAGEARSANFQTITSPAYAPAPLMRVDAELPTACTGAWESGPCRFGVAGLKPMGLHRFVIEENEVRYGQGMVAESRGTTAAFITLIQPSGTAACLLESLRLVPSGGEWILRWRVRTPDRTTGLQARIAGAPA